jgi:hypothetical protein
MVGFDSGIRENCALENKNNSWKRSSVSLSVAVRLQFLEKFIGGAQDAEG